jgi:hypothetical protein
LGAYFDFRRVADDLSASAYFTMFRPSPFGAGVVLSKPETGLEDRRSVQSPQRMDDVPPFEPAVDRALF